MKRDMDLIRQILLEIEKQPFTDWMINLEIEGYSSEEISFHVLLLSEANLIKADSLGLPSGAEWRPTRLTWEGYEFLEAIKDNTRWSEVKNTMSKAGGFVYEVIKSLAIALLKDQVSLLLT